MARISLSPKFIKEVLMLFYERPIKEIFFGKMVTPSKTEKELLERILREPNTFRENGARMGRFEKVDPIHRGVGMVCLLPNILGNERTESLILFGTDTKITQGPDLWVVLSSNANVKKQGLGDHLILELIKGNRGGQAYVVQKTIKELRKYQSVVVWCKQFAVLFTYAPLS